MVSRWILPLALCLFSGTAFAAGITQVKNQKTLIDLTGLENAQVGDEVFAVDMAGKKRALLKITLIKKGKAIAEIVKGKPAVGHEVVLRSGASSGGEAGEGGASADTGGYRASTRSAWGLLASTMQTSMQVNFNVGSGTQTRSVTADMAGTSFGLLGYYDYPVMQDLQIRGLAGMEMLTATGSLSEADCSDSTTCDFKVTYMSLYGLGKYNYMTGKFTGWVGAFYGFLVAASKSSSVLNTSQISTNQIYGAATGFDYSLNRNNTIPVSLEYGIFPASDTVKASILYIRAGYSWGF